MDGTWVSKDRPKITKRGVKMIKKKDKTEENSKEDNKPRTINKTLKEFEEEAIPNNVLYVQNIPNIATEEMLKELFKQYPGFK